MQCYRPGLAPLLGSAPPLERILLQGLGSYLGTHCSKGAGSNRHEFEVVTEGGSGNYGHCAAEYGKGVAAGGYIGRTRQWLGGAEASSSPRSRKGTALLLLLLDCYQLDYKVDSRTDVPFALAARLMEDEGGRCG